MKFMSKMKFGLVAALAAFGLTANSAEYVSISSVETGSGRIEWDHVTLKYDIGGLELGSEYEAEIVFTVNGESQTVELSGEDLSNDSYVKKYDISELFGGCDVSDENASVEVAIYKTSSGHGGGETTEGDPDPLFIPNNPANNGGAIYYNGGADVDSLVFAPQLAASGAKVASDIKTFRLMPPPLGSKDNPWVDFTYGVESYTNGWGTLFISGGDGSVMTAEWAACRDEIFKIEFAADITHITFNIFRWYDHLTNITFAAGSKLERIDSSAFSKSGLISLEIPASVTNIGENAFSECPNLTRVVFAEGSEIETLDHGLFEYCTALETVEIPASVKTISDQVFDYCTNLSSVTFGAGSKLEEIDRYAFWCNYSLKDIQLPNGLKVIEDRAFVRSGLESLTFPASVEEIGSELLTGSTNVASITFLGDNCWIMDEAFLGLGTECTKEDVTYKACPCTLNLPETWTGDKPDYGGMLKDGVFWNWAIKGSDLNPWLIGDNVKAHTNGVGGLLIAGSGAVTETPWTEGGAVGITSVTFGEAVTDFGETLDSLPDLAKINDLPLSKFNSIAVFVQPEGVTAFAVDPSEKKVHVPVDVMISPSEKSPAWTKAKAVDVEIAVPSKVGVIKLLTGAKEQPEKCEE